MKTNSSSFGKRIVALLTVLVMIASLFSMSPLLAFASDQADAPEAVQQSGVVQSDEGQEGSAQTAAEQNDSGQSAWDNNSQSPSEESEGSVQEEGSDDHAAQNMDKTDESAKEDTDDGVTDRRDGNEKEQQEKVSKVKQSKKCGEALITAEYDSDAFDDKAVLHVSRIDNAKRDKDMKVIDKMTGKDVDTDCIFAFDISFTTKDGEKTEPSKKIKVHISLNDGVKAKDAEFRLVHINDNGSAEYVSAADFTKDAKELSFRNDEFSPYYGIQNTGISDAIIVDGKGDGSDGKYETLAGALEAAEDGDIINVTGIAKDTASVKVEKSVTILSDGSEGQIPNGVEIYSDVTIGGGSSLLKSGAVWIYDGEKTAIEDNAYITGSLPVYLNHSGTELVIKGGTIEQTQERNNWNCAVGAYDGKISISGGTIIARGDGVYAYDKMGSVTGGSITAGGNGMYLGWSGIDEFSGCDITAGNNGIHLYYSSMIGEISGGSVTAENGAAIYCEYANTGVGTISGGTFKGGSGIETKKELNSDIIITGGLFNAAGSAFPSNSNVVLSDSVKWTGDLNEGHYSFAEGYGKSADTVKIEGTDYHYCEKLIKVTYHGNGGKTKDNKTESEKTVARRFTTEECAFENEGKYFKEWNTSEDGNGKSYKEEAAAEADGDIDLYAIWKDPSDGPVSIIRDGEETSYATIREAVAAAVDGDTICVNDDVTDTSDVITIDKDITIIAGAESVRSNSANLKVSTGKTLTLGNDSDGSVLKMTGSVTVTNGKIVLRDGVSLRNNLLISGKDAGGTIEGGSISVSSGSAVKLDNGASVDKISGGVFKSQSASALLVFPDSNIEEISGGQFISAGGHGIDLYGSVGSISGEDTLFEGTACGIYVRSNGLLNEIKSGRFISTVTNAVTSIHAGLFVQGKCLRIEGGHFEGSQGADFGNTTNNQSEGVPAGQGVEITGGTFVGNESFGIDFVANNKATVLEHSISNATIISKTYYGIHIGGGNHFSELTDLTVSGDGQFAGLITGIISYSSNKTVIDKIEGGTYSSIKAGKAQIEKINDIKVTGDTVIGWYNGGVSSVGSIENSDFAELEIINGKVETIKGIKAGKLSNSDDGEIGSVGAGTVIDSSDEALTNEGKIGSISDAAIKGTVGIQNDGTIDSIGENVNVTGTQGSAVVSTEDGSIGTISGNGTYYGKENAIVIEGSKKTSLEPGLTGITGTGLYGSAENDAAALLVGNIELPEGYHISCTEKSADGKKYHFIIKDNSVVYDGNGSKTSDGRTQVIAAYEPDNEGKVTLDGNDKIGFIENASSFKGWNTKADGKGDQYKAGDKIAVPEGKDVTVYAQWGKYKINVTHYMDKLVQYGYGLFIGAFEFIGLPDAQINEDYENDYAKYAEEYAEYSISDLFDAQTAENLYEYSKLEKKNSDEELKIGSVVSFSGNDYKLAKVTVNGKEVTDLNSEKYRLKDEDEIKFYYELLPIKIVVEAKSYSGEYDAQKHEVRGFSGNTAKVWQYDPDLHQAVAIETTSVASASDGNENYSFAPLGWDAEGSITNVPESGKKVLPSEGSDYTSWEKDGDNYVIPDGKYKLYYKGNIIYNFDPSVFRIIYKPGTMELTKAALTVAANDQTDHVFDGTVKGETGKAYTDADEIAQKVTADGLKGDDAITSVKLEGSETDAAEYSDKIKITDIKIGEDGEKNANYDITLIDGDLSVKEAQIEYKSDDTAGGTVSLSLEKVGKAGSEVKGSTAEAAEGHHFVNWTDDNDSDKTISENAKFVPEKKAGSYTAHFKANEYSVTFDKNSEKATGRMEDQSFTYGQKDNLKENAFTRKGYIFTGWNTDANGEGTGYADKAEISDLTSKDGEKITLYAQWSADDAGLIYNANEGKGTTEETKGKVDETVKTAENGFEREGYSFTSWNTKADGTGKDYEEGADYTLTADGDILYAQWKINKYDVSFDADGGKPEPEKQSVEYGGKVTEPKAPEKEGYTFDGWFDGEKKYDFDNEVKGEIVLTAHWTKVPEKPAAGTETPSEPEKPAADVTPKKPDAPESDKPKKNVEKQDKNTTSEKTTSRSTARGTATVRRPAAVTAPVNTAPVITSRADADTARNAAEDRNKEQLNDNETIKENKTPLAGNSSQEYWALINLICAVLTVLAAVVTIVRRRERRFIVFDAIAAAASVIILLLTEDFSNKMAMTDKYTVPMAVIAAVGIAACVIALNRKKETGNNEN